MSRIIKPYRRITRRDSLKQAALIPASVIAGGWLIGCSDDAGASAPAQAGGSAPPAGASGGVAGAGGMGAAPAAGSTASGAAGRSASTTAGASASTAAGSGGAPGAAGAGGAAGAPATSATSAGAGGMGAVTGGAPAAGAGGSGVVVPVMGWAAGGTKSMMGPYPDPFAGGMTGSMCTLYPTQTLGPCYANGPEMREDISDGSTGLPMRLSFLVVRGGCEPIPNASVDIWHSGFEGVYSAFATGTICNPGTMDVMSEMFCRGTQVTNESGRADFSTVFPGWYTGRAVHIHFTIRVNGQEEVTSQLYFEDALITEIQSQGEYKPRGMRDTTNTADRTFSSGGASPEDVIMEAMKRPDGALHAWKVISIG